MYSLARPQTFFRPAPRRPTPPARRPAGRPPSPAAKKCLRELGGAQAVSCVASVISKRRRAQFFGWILCVLWVRRNWLCDLRDVLGSRSGFAAVHPPP
jgi:hypothetical protein